MRFSGRFLKFLTAIIALVAGFTVLQTQSGAGTNAKKQLEIKPVKTQEVCMVNDSFMGKPQIPVLFEGKTYYGCCEGCVERIKTDRSIRFSKDPVTGREVDKAKAYIIAAPDGAALYFESPETAREYKPVMTKQ